MSEEITKADPNTELALGTLYTDNSEVVPHAGINTIKIVRETAQFQTGPEEFAKSFVAHPLLIHRANQWWKTSFNDRKEGESTVPNCFSMDDYRPCGGDMIQSDFCATCPQNEFGSGKEGRGKSCRNTIRILLLRENSLLPELLICPPTSVSKNGFLQKWLNSIDNAVAEALRPFGFKPSMSGKGLSIPYWTVAARFELKKQKFESGEASIVAVQTVAILKPDSPAAIERSHYLANVYRAAKDAYAQVSHQYMVDDTEAPF
jgi:hypothetical protein